MTNLRWLNEWPGRLEACGTNKVETKHASQKIRFRMRSFTTVPIVLEVLLFPITIRKFIIICDWYVSSVLQKPSIETMERTCTCTFDMRDNNCLELIERVFYKETKAKVRLVMWLPLRFFSLKIVFITFTSCMLNEKEELYEIRIWCCRKFY